MTVNQEFNIHCPSRLKSVHSQLPDTTMSLRFSSQGSWSPSAFGLYSKAEVACFFRGIYCVLITDEKKVQAVFRICVVLCLWTARFAD